MWIFPSPRVETPEAAQAVEIMEVRAEVSRRSHFNGLARQPAESPPIAFQGLADGLATRNRP